MDTLKFRLNTVERSIILENIQMTQLQYFPTQFPITLETGDT